jgi:hypothetical protein
MRTSKKKTKADRVSRLPNYALKVKVEGPGVHRKSIAIPDLLRICTAIQSAVHRQAESMQRPAANTLRSGPITASAQQECTLELTAITGGSTGLTFRYSKPQQHLPLPGAPHFGTDVLAQVAETVKDFGGRKERPPFDIDPGVLASLKDLSEVLETRRITKILLSVPKSDGKRHTIKAVVTPAIGNRIAARMRAPREERRSVEGRLEMADFKEGGKICRIHPVAGLPIQCSFEPEQEDRIYGALRRAARVTGPCKLNPNTGKIEELKIEELEILDELLLGAKDFFASRTLEQLADAQGVSPLMSPADLAGGWPSDEGVDEFIETTYRGRS